MNPLSQRARAWSWRAAFGLTLLFSLQASAADTSSWKWNDPQDLKIPGLRHGTIESESMKRTVGYNVYLPPQYEKETDRGFPVVYFLHGSGGTESSDAGLAHTVHAEVIAGRIEPVIYVFPNGGKTSGYRDSADGTVKAETLLIRELLPHIDRTYRTVTRPEERGICGFSMGGGGAIRLALKYPSHFGAAASLAAALEETPDANSGDNSYQHASKLTRGQKDVLRLYLVVGEDDFLFPRHAPFLRHLKELGVPYTYVVHAKVGHNLGLLNQLSAEAMIRHLDREQRSRMNPRERK